MQVYRRFLALLRKPFPEESANAYIRNTALISVFITLFLYIFQPFGIHTIPSRKFLICLGFGSMTFIAVMLFEFIHSRILQINRFDPNFTFGRWIRYIMGVLLTISLVNFLFARALQGDMRWEFLPNMIISTFAIGIFPVFTLGFLALLRSERKYKRIAANIQPGTNRNPQHSGTLDLIAGIPIQDIRYVESLQNYVRICYQKEGKIQEIVERATLKELEATAEGTTLLRCHRSYMVNKDYILNASGNAQGLQLRLANCDQTVPVSRSYISLFRDP